MQQRAHIMEGMQAGAIAVAMVLTLRMVKVLHRDVAARLARADQSRQQCPFPGGHARRYPKHVRIEASFTTRCVVAGPRIDVQRDILAEPGEVWTVLTDLERTPRVLRSVERVERLHGEGFDQGVRWREYRRFFGKVESEEMEVALVDPPRRAVLSSESEGTVYRTEFLLVPCAVGTRLRIEFTAETSSGSPARRLAMSLMGLVGARATKRILEDDLEDIAGAVEAPS